MTQIQCPDDLKARRTLLPFSLTTKNTRPLPGLAIWATPDFQPFPGFNFVRSYSVQEAPVYTSSYGHRDQSRRTYFFVYISNSPSHLGIDSDKVLSTKRFPSSPLNGKKETILVPVVIRVPRPRKSSISSSPEVRPRIQPRLGRIDVHTAKAERPRDDIPSVNDVPSKTGPDVKMTQK